MRFKPIPYKTTSLCIPISDNKNTNPEASVSCFYSQFKPIWPQFNYAHKFTFVKLWIQTRWRMRLAAINHRILTGYFHSSRDGYTGTALQLWSDLLSFTIFALMFDN